MTEHDVSGPRKTIAKTSHPTFFMAPKPPLAKEQIVKLIVGAGQASPSPPVGPALGSKGVKSIDFCKVSFPPLQLLLSFSSPFKNFFPFFNSQLTFRSRSFAGEGGAFPKKKTGIQRPNINLHRRHPDPHPYHHPT